MAGFIFDFELFRTASMLRAGAEASKARALKKAAVLPLPDLACANKFSRTGVFLKPSSINGLRGVDSVRTASNSKKKPPTAS